MLFKLWIFPGLWIYEHSSSLRFKFITAETTCYKTLTIYTILLRPPALDGGFTGGDVPRGSDPPRYIYIYIYIHYTQGIKIKIIHLKYKLFFRIPLLEKFWKSATVSILCFDMRCALYTHKIKFKHIISSCIVKTM